jgi:hypothetical protein
MVADAPPFVDVAPRLQAGHGGGRVRGPQRALRPPVPGVGDEARRFRRTPRPGAVHRPARPQDHARAAQPVPGLPDPLLRHPLRGPAPGLRRCRGHGDVLVRLLDRAEEAGVGTWAALDELLSRRKPRPKRSALPDPWSTPNGHDPRTTSPTCPSPAPPGWARSGSTPWRPGSSAWTAAPCSAWCPSPSGSGASPPTSATASPSALRCLLVETPDALVLVDTGVGNKEDEKFHEIYGIENGGAPPASRTPSAPPATGPGTWTSSSAPTSTSTTPGATRSATPMAPSARVPGGAARGAAREYEFASLPNERVRASYMAANYEPHRQAGLWDLRRRRDGDRARRARGPHPRPHAPPPVGAHPVRGPGRLLPRRPRPHHGPPAIALDHGLRPGAPRHPGDQAHPPGSRPPRGLAPGLRARPRHPLGPVSIPTPAAPPCGRNEPPAAAPPGPSRAHWPIGPTGPPLLYRRSKTAPPSAGPDRREYAGEG